MRIKSFDLEFVREPLKAPFGFKGRYLRELWQPIVMLQSDNFTAVSPSVESVLWSDEAVFCNNPPPVSSAMMLTVTNKALQMLVGTEITRPDFVIPELSKALLPYAAEVCGRQVAETFVLNSLVGVDCALWSLWANENNISDFDGIIPDYAKSAMSNRHSSLAHIPLLSYAVDENGIIELLKSGTALLKIKIGKYVCGEKGGQEDMKSMLEWDKQRLSQIHSLAKNFKTDLTKSGNILYYLDANGRYDSLSRMEELLEHAYKIGALDSIALLEEPLPPENETDVSSLPVTVNADESAHSLNDVKKRISQGYTAVALKPIAKTLSVSFLMVSEIAKANCQCLCADLTVNPFNAEWNKQFAARISPLCGMNTGCIEINGNQNYTNWQKLGEYLPAGIKFYGEHNGRFILDESFYACSGKLFLQNGYFDIFGDNK